MEIIFQYFQLCVSESSVPHTTKLMERGCFRKYMPPQSPPYIKSVKWQAENAYAVYDELAENIGTTEVPEQLQIYYKDHFTLKPSTAFTRGCLRRLPRWLRDYPAKLQDRALNHRENEADNYNAVVYFKV